jgi:hypothetical protein
MFYFCNVFFVNWWGREGRRMLILIDSFVGLSMMCCFQVAFFLGAFALAIR